MKFRVVAALFFCLSLGAAEPPNVRGWWDHVQALANDAMGGRDAGSEGYRKAEAYVVGQWERAGVKPAGEHGYAQAVPLTAIRLDARSSKAALVRNGSVHDLQWLREITVQPGPGLPATVEAPLIFAGSQAPAEVAGKLVVQLQNPAGPARTFPGAVGTLTVDTTLGPEPRNWPAPYAVSMSLVSSPPAHSAGGVHLRLKPAAAEALFTGAGHSYADLSRLQKEGQPLPSFPLPSTFRAQMKFESYRLSSDNLIGVFPGSDPELAKEYVVVSAHLDGYGFGEPRNGDSLYNGAFDDAAYVATLIELAEKLHAGSLRPRRSILFAVFTAEEKGLLGSLYFTAHPTVPVKNMIADINLDQLRPLFPLKVLTELAVDESTLGDTARKVASEMGIRIQPDPEPERNLLRRADHFSFMNIGVPATGFIFGYAKGSPEEAIYRRWYAERYHSPADDLKQPWDRQAAAKMNEFFDRLVLAVADAPGRPHWKSGSTYAARQERP